MPSTSNSNARGSAAGRRARKRWLLSPEAGFGGDGEKVPCALGCGQMLTFETLTVDRHPVLGVDGGTYKRGNIRPACAHENYSEGGRLGNERRRLLAEVICYVDVG
jgi:hypothetical protein